MHLHVSGDARLAEVLTADVAEVVGTFVQPLVLLERVTAEESLVAQLAGEEPALLVKPLVLVESRLAGEALLTQAAVETECVDLRVSLQLIGMFKDLLTYGAFGFFFREVFVDGSSAQKPFVLPCGLFPFPLFLVFHVLLLFPLLLSAVLPLALAQPLQVTLRFQFLIVQVLTYLLSPSPQLFA